MSRGGRRRGGGPMDRGRQVEEELRFHVEGRARELEAAGWDPEAARAEALRRFGDPGRIAEACLAARGGEARPAWSAAGEAAWTDVRHALRTLRRSPGFAVVALLTLALGIGATTAVFTLVDNVLLRPLPFLEPDRLVAVWERNLSEGVLQDQPSPPNYVDWRRGNVTFEGLAALGDDSRTLTSTVDPEVVEVSEVSANLFPLLGVEPALGRGFQEGEDRPGAPRVAVVSHGLWQRLLGRDPDLTGRTLALNDSLFQVVGVMPAGFAVPRREVDVWIPEWYESPGHFRSSRYLTVLGRLKQGVDADEATRDLDRIQEEIAADFPATNAGWTVALVPVTEQVVGREARTLLLAVLGAVAFVLLLACVNVANLLLGRTAYREREMAVRAALGAGRGRLRRQLLVESLVLGLLGGALGTAVAWGSVQLLLAADPEAVPRIQEVAVDLRVLLFAGGVSLLTGVLFGVAPAAMASGADPGASLREGAAGAGGGRRAAGRRALVVAEVALSLVLLVGAGLLARSLLSLLRVDPGWDAGDVLVASVSLSATDYRTTAGRVAHLESLLGRLREVPGVRSAGVTTTLPITRAGIDFNLPYQAEGHPALPESELPETDYRVVSPGYFEAMDIALLRGRGFTDLDGAGGRRVLVVNEAFARRHWPGEDALGKTVRIHYVAEEGLAWEVVGVVADTRHGGLSAPPAQQMFVPLAQAEVVFGYMQVAVEVAPGLRPAEVLPDVRRAAAAVDPRYPLHAFTTMRAIVAESVARERFAAMMVGLFGAVALALAAVGIHGVVAFQVARRTREIGVRMALGARRGRVVRGVVGEALGLAGVGVAAGAALAVPASRALEGLLFGVGTTDPVTYAAVAGALLAVAGGAALAPALRAASLDPSEALREG